MLTLLFNLTLCRATLYCEEKKRQIPEFWFWVRLRGRILLFLVSQTPLEYNVTPAKVAKTEFNLHLNL